MYYFYLQPAGKLVFCDNNNDNNEKKRRRRRSRRVRGKKGKRGRKRRGRIRGRGEGVELKYI